MFANGDSLHIPADVRAGLRTLFAQLVRTGIAPAVPPIDIIEPALLVAPVA